MNLAEAQGLLPGFRFTEVLNPGAQGDVFRGIAADGQPVVVKIVDGGWQERGEREIAALGLVSHPSVVRLKAHGVVTSAGRDMVYLATAYVDGTDLGQKLRSGPIHCRDAARIVSSVAEGLDAIWAHRIVHRDIKPPNIIVSPDGRGILLDLGVALCQTMSTLTTWGVPGTLGYMSPEQCTGERNLTVKSDVFALGVTAYEALAGTHPYGHNQELIARRVVSPKLPASVGCGIGLTRLIAAMLHPSAAYRPMPHEIVTTLGPEAA